MGTIARRAARIALLAGGLGAIPVMMVGAPAAADSRPPNAAPMSDPSWCNYISNTDRPTLRRGSQGAAVQQVQCLINANSNYSEYLAEDGAFGQQTQAGVEYVQRCNKISVDGVVGPNTWQVLYYPSGNCGPNNSSSVDGRFVFHKNPSDPTNSRLEWRVVNLSTNEVVRSVEWRAGSGLGGADGTNDCAKNRGWLPNGSYGGTFYPAHNAALIKGGQDSSIEAQYWDGDGDGDYKSEGCIKLKPSDIKAAAAEFQQYYTSGHHYSKLLDVVS